ncbi:hypothetical protein F5B20DRAFT_518414 [Whalleya microplaca]|nr:hypothetical protein F5B20DRAFT_518414 [Whalleya microplaca]
MLLRLEDLSKVGKEEMIDLLGEPVCEMVRVYNGPEPGSMAPKYVIEPVDLTAFAKNEVAIIDFGESFTVGNPPDFLGIPCMYAAPEVRLGGHQPGLSIDVWSLACTILDVRGNYTIMGATFPSYVMLLEVLLGPLPEPYRASYLKQLDDAQLQGKQIPIVSDLAKEGNGNNKPLVPVTNIETFKRLSDRKDEIGRKTGYTDRFCQTLAQTSQYSGPPLDDGGNEIRDSEWVEIQFKIPDEEVIILGDLLRKVIKYEPENRINIDTILQHEWFKETNGWTGEVTRSSSPFISEPGDILEQKETDVEDGEDARSHLEGEQDRIGKQGNGEKSAEGLDTPLIPDFVIDTLNGTLTQEHKPLNAKFSRLSLPACLDASHQWTKLRQSRALHNLQNTIFSRKFVVYITIGSVLATALLAILVQILLSRRQVQMALTRRPCQHEVFITPTMVRSSISTYFEGLIMFFGSGKTDGTCDCTFA